MRHCRSKMRTYSRLLLLTVLLIVLGVYTGHGLYRPRAPGSHWLARSSRFSPPSSRLSSRFSPGRFVCCHGPFGWRALRRSRVSCVDPRPRRHGPWSLRADARRRQASQPGRAARPRMLPAARLDRAANLPGRVVHLPDRRQPGQTQHLRLLDPGLAHLSRQTELRRDPAAAAVDQDRALSDPAGQGQRAPSPQE